MSQVIVTTREELATIMSQVVRRELCLLRQMPPQGGDDSLTPQQAAEYLNQSVNTLRQWRSQGRGPAYEKRGRNIRYHKRDLDAWRDANVVVTAEACESRRSALTSAGPLRVVGEFHA